MRRKLRSPDVLLALALARWDRGRKPRHERRSGLDRRSGGDRRREQHGPAEPERRSGEERRRGDRRRVASVPLPRPPR